MAVADPPTVPVVVAFVRDESKKKLLLAWNDNWGGHAYPMTKQDPGPPAETLERAALRAAAEVVRRPVRLVAGMQTRTTRDLLLGGRDATIKNYVYAVVAVEVHPDFAGQTGAGFWAAVERLEADEYHPLTDSVRPLLAEFREWGWIG